MREPDPTAESAADPLFAGEGEVAALMRGLDWSATPLGRSQAWPQSLRAAVRIVLSSRFAMWMGWGPELTFFYNDAYAAMTLGAKHPWALARSAREVWSEIWEQIAPRVEQVLTRGTATWDERLLLFLQRSGFPEETYHTFSYSPLAHDDGRPAGMLCVVSEETERVISERRLALLHELATQLSGADTPPRVLEAIGRCLAKDARDLPFAIVYTVGPDDRAEIAAVAGLPPDHPALQAGRPIDAIHRPIDEVIATGKLALFELPQSLAWPSGPWPEPPLQAAVLPISQPGQSRPTGVVLAALNRFRPFDEAYRTFTGLFVGQISAGLAGARQFEAERQRADALAELDRAKTAFFSNVSHEFRTPLTLMLGPTEDALAGSRSLDGVELASVHRNLLRLLKLVNTLLDFSRMESGRLNAAYQAVDVAALTADVASTFRSAVERAGIALTIDVATPTEAVFVDPQLWEGILLNLLSNAFKFTFEGEIAVRLRELRPSAIELSVSDSGVGIPSAELPRIFERFHRIEGSRSRSHEGSGIGLALVHDLVHLHGGQIDVESVLGQGTTFRISLPTGHAHLRPEQIVTTATREGSSVARKAFVAETRRWLPEASDGAGPELTALAAGDLPPGRILVADDNADMRDYLVRLLGTHFSVETANDGAEALASARRRAPDLIVTDVMMPHLDGFSLLAELRADRTLSSVPVIMLSARAGEEARIEGIQAGADDYLVKPFSARELLARVVTRLELVRLRKRLAIERASITNLIDHNPLPIAVLRGADLVYEAANTAYIAVVGKREILGKPLLTALPELVGQGFDALLQTVLSSGNAHVGRETVVRLERGGRLEDTYFTFIYAPVLNEDGQADRVIVFCNDVTEQVEARRRLEVLAQEAATANRAKDEFLAMLGHELRNPLAPMRTALQLLRLRGQTSREHDVLERQVAHLERLVNDLLDVSRITRGKLDLDLAPVELSQIVVRAVELVSPLLERSHHQLAIDVPETGLLLFADIDRLAQVVSNLLTNAAKYSDPHTQISLRADQLDGRVRLRVRDQGIGIAASMLEGVFDAFIQQPQSLDRARGGLGLGLTIVRSLVEKHAGSVRAESPGAGQGSEFIVELPTLDPSQHSARGTTQAVADGTHAGPRDKRILVVDDNEDAGEMLKQALEELGYRVELAHDGPSALRIAAALQPDVALLDIGLPVMDGYELAQRLRGTSPGTRPPRLLAVTGYGQANDRQRSLDAGFEDHLVKPIDLARLERAIEMR